VLGWFIVVEGRILDEDGLPIAVAEVVLMGEDGTELATVYTDPDGSWSSPLYGTETIGNMVDILVSADGYADGIAHYEVDLSSPDLHSLQAGPGNTFNTTPRKLPALRLAAADAGSKAQGVLVDAVSGQPVEGVSLTLQRGWNAPPGSRSEDSVTTDRDGHFEVLGSYAGAYTIYSAPNNGYAGTRFPIFLSDHNTSVTGAISTLLESHRVRASLLWGGNPANLDLHMTYPDPEDNIGRYHLWSGEPAWPTVGDNYGKDSLVELEAHDGEGPETLAVYVRPGVGLVQLTVLDPGREDEPEATTLAGSEAVLQVWYGDDTPRYFQVDPLTVGNWWRPVEIQVGQYNWFQVEQYQGGISEEQSAEF
jgi:hypothetical protein